MRSLLIAAIALGLLSTPAPALADTSATTSIAQLMVCKGRELSDTSIQILFAAFRSEYRVTLEYVPVDYKGKPFRCLTGLVITKT